MAEEALVVVDVQNDFCPGGALGVEGGHDIVPIINQLMGEFEHVILTQDWHPADHSSFASQHPGKAPFETVQMPYGEQKLWPDHCVQGTPGAALDARVDWSLADLILRKGTRPQVDSYSAFRENVGPDGHRPPTGLAGWLRERGIEEVHLCGLARDYCVLWSAQDAIEAGLRASVLWELTRPVTPEGDAPTRAALGAAGASVEQVSPP